MAPRTKSFQLDKMRSFTEGEARLIWSVLKDRDWLICPDAEKDNLLRALAQRIIEGFYPIDHVSSKLLHMQSGHFHTFWRSTNGRTSINQIRVSLSNEVNGVTVNQRRERWYNEIMNGSLTDFQDHSNNNDDIKTISKKFGTAPFPNADRPIWKLLKSFKVARNAGNYQENDEEIPSAVTLDALKVEYPDIVGLLHHDGGDGDGSHPEREEFKDPGLEDAFRRIRERFIREEAEGKNDDLPSGQVQHSKDAATKEVLDFSNKKLIIDINGSSHRWPKNLLHPLDIPEFSKLFQFAKNVNFSFDDSSINNLIQIFLPSKARDGTDTAYQWCLTLQFIHMRKIELNPFYIKLDDNHISFQPLKRRKLDKKIIENMSSDILQRVKNGTASLDELELALKYAQSVPDSSDVIKLRNRIIVLLQHKKKIQHDRELQAVHPKISELQRKTAVLFGDGKQNAFDPNKDYENEIIDVENKKFTLKSSKDIKVSKKVVESAQFLINAISPGSGRSPEQILRILTGGIREVSECINNDLGLTNEKSRRESFIAILFAIFKIDELSFIALLDFVDFYEQKQRWGAQLVEKNAKKRILKRLNDNSFYSKFWVTFNTIIAHLNISLNRLISELHHSENNSMPGDFNHTFVARLCTILVNRMKRSSEEITRLLPTIERWIKSESKLTLFLLHHELFRSVRPGCNFYELGNSNHIRAILNDKGTDCPVTLTQLVSSYQKEDPKETLAEWSIKMTKKLEENDSSVRVPKSDRIPKYSQSVKPTPRGRGRGTSRGGRGRGRGRSYFASQQKRLRDWIEFCVSHGIKDVFRKVDGVSVCRDFNYDDCNRSGCYFGHFCVGCGGKHSFKDCPKR